MPFCGEALDIIEPHIGKLVELDRARNTGARAVGAQGEPNRERIRYAKRKASADSFVSLSVALQSSTNLCPSMTRAVSSARAVAVVSASSAAASMDVLTILFPSLNDSTATPRANSCK